jgi:hypothetical protein
LPSFPQKVLFRIFLLKGINSLDLDKKNSFLRSIFPQKIPWRGDGKNSSYPKKS